MIIFGYEGIPYPRLIKIHAIEDVQRIHSSYLVWFEAKDDDRYALSHHCFENNVKYAIKVENIIDFIFYASLGASYVILDKSPEIYQKIAETYLFDMKILYVIEDKVEIEALAKLGIDGVVFRDILG
ncbi:hypothetical protein BKH42_06580 [Helicobacter sp. 13S00482-2]|uniref:hypothetical protein n=1 Tax=Helicobacter sp. 13S00482-2 TaxID=1476200 RepID=UPI000BA6CB56|nr:hypothetical protein [Helicobacter sp. 13S00482-2]PAF53280.1 hypothetical protein BKH42_06580 [Helicobacter sp. 13S00482-2]